MDPRVDATERAGLVESHPPLPRGALARERGPALGRRGT